LLVGALSASATTGTPTGDDLDQASAYAQPLAHLNESELQMFAAGKAEFAARWVPPFLSGGHWGRGPQSNAQSCLECHPGNGRGRAPEGVNEQPLSLVLRLAVPGQDAAGRPSPHPTYGTHLNRFGILGKLIEEGDFAISYRFREMTLRDGSRVELRDPVVNIRALWYGPLGENTVVSLRIAQPVFGLGLLQAVPEAALAGIAAHQQNIGFNGRLNRVRDELTGERVIGRFGHKAVHPDLAQQVAAAFYEEIGVTSPYFPHEQCWPVQQACYEVERLSGPEASPGQIAVITDYLRLLAPPLQRDRDDPEVKRGARLFDKALCSVCHVPELPVDPDSRASALAGTIIRPFTDLLLHDMGAGLADRRSEFLAGGQDWRTPPLWGLGLRRQVSGNDNLLHDGRARNVTEAIMWHGGEAAISRDAFTRMDRRQRQALLRFVESL
jgi:CxxC motif-containing protein (DUF1111 family)